MIGIDIIRKKRKTGGTGSGSVGSGISTPSGGDAQNAVHADDADHANRADEAAHAASAKELDGTSSVWNTIRTWVSGATDGLKDIFLRKDQDDETTHKLTMAEASVKGDLTLGTNGTYSISKEGVAKLAGVVAEYLKSSNFQPGTAMGFDGQGYGITKDKSGKYTLEIDNLIARMKMIVAELEVHEMSFIGGTVVMSSCGNRVDRVEALDADGNPIATADSNNLTLTIPDGKTAEKFRCYFLASDGDRQIKNEWTVGQLAKAETNNIAAPGNYKDYQNRAYWRLVVGVSSAPVTKEGKQYHYIDLSNSTSKDIVLTDAAGTTSHVTLGGVSETLNSLPFAGDNVIGMGHCLDDTRKNVAILSVDSLGWKLYKGIDHYDLPEENIVNQFSIDKTIVTTDHFILRPYAAPKETQTVAAVRGPYSDTKDYGHNDLTTLDGQTWIGSGIPIGKTIKGERPSATSPYWSLAAAKGIQGDKGDGYSISFLLNNVPVDVINFDTVKGMEGSEVTLEADFYNNAAPANVNKAVITCYDADGNVLGSPIEATKAENIVVDGGNLYLSKLCAYITTVAYAADGKMLVSKSIGVVRNGESVGVKSVTYKVINDMEAGDALNWDSVTAQTTYPTQKPGKGKYCYVMTIVAYSDGTTTNTVSTSYTPKDGNDGTSVKVTSTKVEYVGSDSGTTPPSSGWQTAVPQLAQGKYLWTRTTVSYSDNNSTTSYSVGRIGMDGSKGGTTHILYASSANPQSKDDVRTTIDAQHQYYGTYQDTEINDAVEKYKSVTSWVLIKGDQGTTGSSLVTLITDYTYNQSEINAYSKDGYSGTWAVQSTAGAKVGDTVLLRVTNVSKGGYSFIIAKTTALPSSTSVTCTSNGLIDKGEQGTTGSSLVTLITDYTYNQSEINAYSKDGYSGTWAVQSTAGAKVGDTVLLRVTNASKGGYSFIIAKITALPSSTSVTCTSNGLIDKGEQGDKGDNYSVVFLLNGARVDVLNFDDVRTLTDATFEADFYNQGVAVNVPKATLTCYDKDGNVLGSPIEIENANNIVADGGNLYLSKDCKTITAVGKDGDNVLFSSSVAVIRSTITYRLIPMSDCSATVKASGTSTNATFSLSYNLHYKAAKLVGDRAEDATIATIAATIENKTVTTTVNNTEGTLSGNGDKSYTSDNRPADSIPVAVALSDGTVLYDTVKVTMEAGVAVDINQNLATVTQTVADNKGYISTLQHRADSISLKVSNMNDDLLSTGIDIKNKKITATTDKFVVNNNSGNTTFYIDEDGNIMGTGDAYFKGTITGSVIKGSTIQSSDGTNTTTIKGGSITTNNIEATGGSIGAWTIKDGGLSAEYGSNAKISLYSPDNFFALDSNNNTNGGYLLSLRNDAGGSLYISCYGTDKAALFVRNNNGEHLAISTFGRNSFISRPKEGTMINRFAYACIRTGDVNVDFDNFFVSHETDGNKFPGNMIVTTNYNYEQTVKFPANPVLGVQLIVIQGTNKKVHFDGNGHSFQQGTDVSSSANSNQNGQWNLFIFDGQYWQCVYIPGHLLW